MDTDKLGYTLRNIQDEIFSCRASSPPVHNGIQAMIKFTNEQVYDDFFEKN